MLLMLSLTQIGPSTGVAGLGAAVTSSALTSVGTLTSLTVSGNVNFTGTGYLQLPSGTNAEQPGQTGAPAAAAGQLRYNTSTSVFEGYDGNVWGKIGGGAAIQSAAPSPANPGDLWYDTDDGRMFVYYTDSNSSQWVDASPNGVPTDLTVDGTLSVSGTTTLSGNTQIGGTLGVGGATPSSYNAFINGLVVSRGGINEGITIDCSNQGGLFFVNGTSSYAGQVIYYHTPGDESMRFLAQGEKLRLEEGGAVLPGSDNTQDLGSTSKRWANIYSADLQLSNEGAANDVDGTWGQYTIQEGEDDLFLINRRSGKKYKFMLQEVN